MGCRIFRVFARPRITTVMGNQDPEAISHNEMTVGDEADESAEESLEEEEAETSDAEDAIEAGNRSGQRLNPAHERLATFWRNMDRLRNMAPPMMHRYGQWDQTPAYFNPPRTFQIPGPRTVPIQNLPTPSRANSTTPGYEPQRQRFTISAAIVDPTVFA